MSNKKPFVYELAKQRVTILEDDNKLLKHKGYFTTNNKEFALEAFESEKNKMKGEVSCDDTIEEEWLQVGATYDVLIVCILELDSDDLITNIEHVKVAWTKVKDLDSEF